MHAHVYINLCKLIQFYGRYEITKYADSPKTFLTVCAIYPYSETCAMERALQYLASFNKDLLIMHFAVFLSDSHRFYRALESKQTSKKTLLFMSFVSSSLPEALQRKGQIITALTPRCRVRSYI